MTSTAPPTYRTTSSATSSASFPTSSPSSSPSASPFAATSLQTANHVPAPENAPLILGANPNRIDQKIATALPSGASLAALNIIVGRLTRGLPIIPNESLQSVQARLKNIQLNMKSTLTGRLAGTGGARNSTPAPTQLNFAQINQDKILEKLTENLPEPVAAKRLEIMRGRMKNLEGAINRFPAHDRENLLSNLSHLTNDELNESLNELEQKCR